MICDQGSVVLWKPVGEEAVDPNRLRPVHAPDDRIKPGEIVAHDKLRGPSAEELDGGVIKQRVQQRADRLTPFLHFAPTKEHCPIISGNHTTARKAFSKLRSLSRCDRHRRLRADAHRTVPIRRAM